MCIVNTPKIVRMNITVPTDILSELKKYAPVRGVSNFLVEAAKEKIARIEKDKALKELLMAPVTFIAVKDAVSFIKNQRSLDEKRLKRLGV